MLGIIYSKLSLKGYETDMHYICRLLCMYVCVRVCVRVCMSMCVIYYIPLVVTPNLYSLLLKIKYVF